MTTLFLVINYADPTYCDLAALCNLMAWPDLWSRSWGSDISCDDNDDNNVDAIDHYGCNDGAGDDDAGGDDDDDDDEGDDNDEGGDDLQWQDYACSIVILLL